MEKTVKERLEMIPFENARRLALEKYDPLFLEKHSFYFDDKTSVAVALGVAFRWDGDFNWPALFHSLVRMEQSIKLK